MCVYAIRKFAVDLDRRLESRGVVGNLQSDAGMPTFGQLEKSRYIYLMKRTLTLRMSENTSDSF